MSHRLAVIVVLYASLLQAGPAGLVVKGVVKTWEEVARTALRASGRATSDEAVRAAARTLQRTSEEYGDDIASAAMRSGVEIAEQTARHGAAFSALIGRASRLSADGLREIALRSDDMLKWAGKYGDDVLRLNGKAPGMAARGIPLLEKSGAVDVAGAIGAIGKLPAEDIPRVIGALEKNPGVIRQFVGHLEAGGRHFVDRLFSLNGKQILAGTLGLAAIEAADNVTAPMRETGDNVRKDGEKVREIVDGMSSEDRRAWAEARAAANDERAKGLMPFLGTAALVVVGLLALLIVRRSRR